MKCPYCNTYMEKAEVDIPGYQGDSWTCKAEDCLPIIYVPTGVVPNIISDLISAINSVSSTVRENSTRVYTKKREGYEKGLKDCLGVMVSIMQNNGMALHEGKWVMTCEQQPKILRPV